MIHEDKCTGWPCDTVYKVKVRIAPTATPFLVAFTKDGVKARQRATESKAQYGPETVAVYAYCTTCKVQSVLR